MTTSKAGRVRVAPVGSDEFSVLGEIRSVQISEATDYAWFDEWLDANERPAVYGPRALTEAVAISEEFALPDPEVADILFGGIPIIYRWLDSRGTE